MGCGALALRVGPPTSSEGNGNPHAAPRPAAWGLQGWDASDAPEPRERCVSMETEGQNRGLKPLLPALWRRFNSSGLCVPYL